MPSPGTRRHNSTAPSGSPVTVSACVSTVRMMPSRPRDSHPFLRAIGFRVEIAPGRRPDGEERHRRDAGEPHGAKQLHAFLRRRRAGVEVDRREREVRGLEWRGAAAVSAETSAGVRCGPVGVNRQVGLREMHLADRPQSVVQRELAEAERRARDVHGVAPLGRWDSSNGVRRRIPPRAGWRGVPRSTPRRPPAGRGVVPQSWISGR